MKEFHFSLGNSMGGPIGFAAVIRAETQEEAVQRLKDLLPEEERVLGYDSPLREGEYISVYFHPAVITVDDIDEEEDV